MNYSQHFLAIKRLTFPLLLLALLSDALPAPAHAVVRERSDIEQREARTQARGDKVSSKLLRKARRARRQDERLRVIVQFEGKANAAFDLFLQSHGARTTRQYPTLNARAVELPARAVKALAARGELRFASPDEEMIPAGHVSETTGTDAVRDTKAANGMAGLDGTGLGIAVLDSGIDQGHRSFLNKDNKSRIVFSRDFTGEGRTDDPYGHGTHVASIAAGNGRISNAEYIGIAPNANIVNLRVLDSKGQGTTSGLLAALEWVAANRTVYNIRVVNMSLGTPAVESYRNDPICRAVRRLVDAGIVVAAAAGNNGRNSSGQKLYGQIHSPGNEPSALTVGASNTFGSHARADDGVASFSSRGPTRSYWTDALGTKRYDSLIKPDIVAPGNKLIYAEAIDNYLVRQNPELDAGVSPVDNRRMMFMNGSSMATPVAAGAAALLLQTNPKLTPNMVKMILMYTAQPLAGFNMFEQGAGQLNVEGAVRLAKVVRTDLSALTLTGAPLLTTPAPPAPQTTIAGHTFTWSQGLIMGRTFATGANLALKYQRIYSHGIIFGDAVIFGDGIIFGDNTLLSSGIIFGDHVLTCDGGTLANGIPFLNVESLKADGIIFGDNTIFGDGILFSDGIIFGDTTLRGDAVTQAQSARTNGDLTSAMELEVDTGVDYIGY